MRMKLSKTVELLAQMKALGIELSAEGDKLRIDAPKGVLSPSIRELLSEHKTDILQFLHTSKHTGACPLIPAAPRDGHLPASFSQERLWFLAQLEPDSLAYNIPGVLRLTGPLRVEILERCLLEILRRHEALRTTFKKTDGGLAQVISPAGTFHLPLVDLGEVSEPERTELVTKIGIEETRRRFDLSAGPLFRASLVRLGEHEHLLYFTMHHIVTDGWSFGIFQCELASTYRAFVQGQPLELPDLPVQYPDYAHWQRQWLQGDILQAQLAYWKRKLGGELPMLQLPTDRPRPPVQSHRGASLFFDLPERLTEGLKALSREEGVTLFMTLLAAFKVMLFRYSGQTDVAVGSPIANRNRPEIEDLIGFFVNTLTIRTNLSGNPRFRELLGRVQETSLEAFGHQDLPFEKLVEALNPTRDMSYSPLFQVMFAFQNVPEAAVEIPGLTIVPEKIDAGSSMFDLTLYMGESEGGLSGQIEYNTDLFDGETINGMVVHFETLLSGIVADPGQRISELPFMTDFERQRLLVEWNATEQDYPSSKTIVHLFEEQVQRTPDAVAAVHMGESITFRELNLRSNRLARYLTAHGVNGEHRVGIWMDRSLGLMAALLGTLKAGGAYVPLDPNYPQERLAFMLENAQAEVLLTEKRFIQDLPDYGGHVVCVDRDAEAISRESAENPVGSIGPDNAAYVIYTSGSTGTPKGVIGLHRGVVNRLSWMWRTYPFRAGEVCCQKTALSFVDSVWEIFGPMLQGVPVVIVPGDALKDPQRFIETLAASKVSRMVLVPSLLRALLDGLSDLQQQLPHLMIWITSGEEISVELANRFRQAMPGAKLINLYGSSEVSADVTCYEMAGELAGPRVPIGRPIDNTHLYLLDEALNPVPVGVHGELYVGGAGLARGYFNCPDLTAEKFIPSPFHPNAVLFKTGDLGRRLSDGNVEYLGRRDHQVKIRGHRVELGEIEARIKETDAVNDSVVVLREDHPGDQRLAAYCVAAPGCTLSPNDLRTHLRSKLPDYMVPQHFVEMSSIPLTPNGKVDRRALPKPEAEIASASTYVAPQTEIERAIAEVWREVLKIEKVGLQDNFFDLGGHSLLLARVLSKIRDLLGKQIPMLALFQFPTIGALCRHLCQAEIQSVSAEKIRARADKQKHALMSHHHGRKIRVGTHG
jgi:amino acid adenylation domain-containing protein